MPSKKKSKSPPNNRGAQRLRKWIADQEIPQRRVSQAIDCDQSTITLYLQGDRVPALKYAVGIQKLTDGFVQAEHWLQPSR